MKRPRDRSTVKAAKGQRRAAALQDDHPDSDATHDLSMRLPVVVKPVRRSVSHEPVQGLFAALTVPGASGAVVAAIIRVAAAVVLRGDRP